MLRRPDAGALVRQFWWDDFSLAAAIGLRWPRSVPWSASKLCPRSTVSNRRPARGRAPPLSSEPARFPRRMSGGPAGSRAIRCADSVEPRLAGASRPKDFVYSVRDDFRRNVVALDTHRLLNAPDHPSATLRRLATTEQTSNLGQLRRPGDGWSSRGVRHEERVTPRHCRRKAPSFTRMVKATSETPSHARAPSLASPWLAPSRVNRQMSRRTREVSRIKKSRTEVGLARPRQDRRH
jgi:hypothetical protein